MRVGLQNGTNFDIQSSLVEPFVNRDASEYVAEHYEDIVKKVYQMGVPKDNVRDLVHDVYMSLSRSESEGKGYNSNYKDEEITLEQFVYGRLKGYSKNAKYYSDGVEHVGKSIELLEPKKQIAYGFADDNGKVFTKEVTKNGKHKISATVFSSSFEELNSLYDKNDSFQIAYRQAATFDDLDEIDEVESIRSQLSYCIDFSELHKLNILNVLKNIDILANNLDDSSRHRKSYNPLFSAIAEAVSFHNEFADALKSVLMFSENHKLEFNMMLQEYQTS